MKHSYKTNNNKKAFTLIELLIVIAIIGILFIVLVSRVDFATDKAKATGVQTDFRSFQVAFETVSKENAGFNMFGWDTGDANGDHIRNSYDRGDTNKNGKEDPGETFTGRKTYGETWTTVYTMLNPKVGMENDDSAFVALEQAINANLDPKLHITITPDVEGGALTGNATITMANQARDPWKNEYHGVFITNADEDGQDRGAIIMYSNGANGKWGSAHDIANGVVNITVPNNNVAGQDDYSMSVFYSYANGYGEVAIVTAGFSNNQKFLGEKPTEKLDVVFPEAGTENVLDESKLIEFTVGMFESKTNYTPGQYTTVEYEVTKVREKKPVANSQTLQFTGHPDSVNLETLNPACSTHKSEYMVYAVYKAGSSNGYVNVHYDQRFIVNSVDDTLENAIYLAAYMKTASNISYHIAKWNGSEYVKVNYRAQIDAITEFTETYTVTEYKSVQISAPNSNTEYVYIPGGTMQAEKGMTWSEWIASEYNTVGVSEIYDANYNLIDLNTTIIANMQYGFISNVNNDNFFLSWNSMDLVNNAWIDMGGMPIVLVSPTIPSEENLSRLSVAHSHIYMDDEFIAKSSAGTIKLMEQGENYAIYGNNNNLGSMLLVFYEAGEFNGIAIPEAGIYAIHWGLMGISVDYTMGISLPSPQYISLSNQTVTFSPVRNATAYEIYLNDTLALTTTKTTVDLSSILNDGAFVMVRAIAPDSYAPSNYTSVWYGTRQEPGLYDSNNNLIASWPDLLFNYGMDIEFDYSGFQADNGLEYYNMSCSPYNVLQQPALAAGTKLIIGFCNKVGRMSFRETSLTEIIFDKSATPTTIGDQAFYSLSSLKYITIPASVQSIDVTALQYCRSLQRITVDPQNAHYQDIDGNLYSKDGTVLIVYCSQNPRTSFIVPNTVQTIRQYAFVDADYLISITISANVKQINNNAFYQCDSLVEVCNLSSLNIVAGANTHGGVAAKAKVVIKDPAQSAFKQNGDFIFYDDGGNITLIKYTGTATQITLPNYGNGQLYKIGDYAFYENTTLTHVAIPDYVIAMGKYAFANCTSLTNIRFGNGLTSISSCAFYGCSSLSNIEWSNTITEIGTSAFSGCTALTNVVLPETITTLRELSFAYCYNLTTITLPNSITTMEKQVFWHCESLKIVQIPTKIQKLEYGMFGYCHSLQTIIIPTSLTVIGQEAFNGDALDAQIYYMGTQSQWAKISIDKYNYIITNGNVTYNYVD